MDDDRDTDMFPSDFAFRLIYNGHVLTSRIACCPEDSDLCDADQLVDLVKPMATRKVECIDPSTEHVDAMQIAKSIVSKTEGVFLVLLVIAMGAFGGGVLVFFKLTGTMPEKLKRHKKRKVTNGFGRRSSAFEQIEMTMSDAGFVDPHDDDPYAGSSGPFKSRQKDPVVLDLN